MPILKNNNSNSIKLQKIGDLLQDEDGNLVTITKSDDPHNIECDIHGGGFGIYCIVPSCEFYDKLFRKFI